MEVIRKPLIVKNISTPINPPLKFNNSKWNNITKIIIDGCFINPIEVYFLNSNGKYEDTGEDELSFEVDYIGDDWKD